MLSAFDPPGDSQKGQFLMRRLGEAPNLRRGDAGIPVPDLLCDGNDERGTSGELDQLSDPRPAQERQRHDRGRGDDESCGNGVTYLLSLLARGVSLDFIHGRAPDVESAIDDLTGDLEGIHTRQPTRPTPEHTEAVDGQVFRCSLESRAPRPDAEGRARSDRSTRHMRARLPGQTAP